MLMDDLTGKGIDYPRAETGEPVSERSVLELGRKHIGASSCARNTVYSLLLAFLQGMVVPGAEPGLVALKDRAVEIQRDYLDFILVKHGYILAQNTDMTKSIFTYSYFGSERF